MKHAVLCFSGTARDGRLVRVERSRHPEAARTQRTQREPRRSGGAHFYRYLNIEYTLFIFSHIPL